MRTLDELRYVLGLVHAQIAAADSKATAVLTIAGVLIAFPAPSILVRQTNAGIPVLAAVFAIAAAIAFIVSVFAALYVLFSRVTNDTPAHSLHFFGNIAALKPHEYADALNNADDDRIRDDLTSQVHMCARIAAQKHGHFKIAVRSLILGVLCLSVAYAVLAVAATNGQQPWPPSTDVRPAA